MKINESPNTFPLICPACWKNLRQEILLDAECFCHNCNRKFPVVDGVPVLHADKETVDAFLKDEPLADERTAFYQRVDNYNLPPTDDSPNRDKPHSNQDHESVSKALAHSNAIGWSLEVGCGSGDFAKESGSSYCGLDYSLARLRQHEGRHWICASAEIIPFAAATCRFVFSFSTMEHVPRPDLAFNEIDRVLAIGGIAFVKPAWHVPTWQAEGIPVRPYRDLDVKQRVTKTLIPIRSSLVYRGIKQITWRLYRRIRFLLTKRPMTLAFKPLKANYTKFWMSDSDACSSIDSHEGILFFKSRGYEILSPGSGFLKELLFRSGPVIARKLK
jgi:ubiquinone/menaquinone biosynthesis C-methylase UbiE/uncharacterized protein YbaR (Trm112 family)